ncbi:MAG TPA: SDR family oxidoreductase [Pirellulales bacterium]|nr:SDR family oxidoreductase [Pirellulales bacterium]
MRVIRGKRALVTGAAGGIGREVALALAAEGARLFLLDIDEPGLAGVVDHCRQRGSDALGRVCDVSKSHAISDAVATVLDHWGGLDILVNNAGVAYYGRTELMDPKQWDRLLAINLLAPIQFTRELLPSLLEQGEAHLVNMCSVAGLVPFRKLAAYQATKFGLVGFSLSLHTEYWRYGLGVTALCPGFARTAIFDNAMRSRSGRPIKAPPRWALCSAESVAARCVRAIRRNERLVTVTPFARLLWGLQRLSPSLMNLMVRGHRIPWQPADTQPLPPHVTVRRPKQPAFH